VEALTIRPLEAAATDLVGPADIDLPREADAVGVTDLAFPSELLRTLLCEEITWRLDDLADLFDRDVIAGGESSRRTSAFRG
jgi:hypothetical protein